MKLLLLKLGIVYMLGCCILAFDTVDACDIDRVSVCNQMLGTSVQTLSQGILPDANSLKKICSLLNNITKCIDEKLTGCQVSSKTELVLKSVKDFDDFLCRDSYQAIKDNSDCWTNPAFRSHIHQCMATFNKTTHDAKGLIHVKGRTWLFRQLCGAMHSGTNCMSGAAKIRCGMVPEQIMHNLMTVALRETYKLAQGCSVPTLHIITTTSATRDSRTTAPTSDSIITTYSYALYVTAIISCFISTLSA